MIVWRLRDFEGGDGALTEQSGSMLVELVVACRLGFVQEGVVGHTKPVRARARNVWSELNVVLRRVKVRAPDAKWGSVAAGESLNDDHRAGTEGTTENS